MRRREVHEAMTFDLVMAVLLGERVVDRWYGSGSVGAAEVVDCNSQKGGLPRYLSQPLNIKVVGGSRVISHESAAV